MEERSGGITKEEKKQIFASLDEKLCKMIIETIIESGPGVRFQDIIGLQDVK